MPTLEENVSLKNPFIITLLFKAIHGLPDELRASTVPPPTEYAQQITQPVFLVDAVPNPERKPDGSGITFGELVGFDQENPKFGKYVAAELEYQSVIKTPLFG